MGLLQLNSRAPVLNELATISGFLLSRHSAVTWVEGQLVPNVVWGLPSVAQAVPSGSIHSAAGSSENRLSLQMAED